MAGPQNKVDDEATRQLEKVEVEKVEAKVEVPARQVAIDPKLAVDVFSLAFENPDKLVSKLTRFSGSADEDSVFVEASSDDRSILVAVVKDPEQPGKFRLGLRDRIVGENIPILVPVIDFGWDFVLGWPLSWPVLIRPGERTVPGRRIRETEYWFDLPKEDEAEALKIFKAVAALPALHEPPKLKDKAKKPKLTFKE